LKGIFILHQNPDFKRYLETERDYSPHTILAYTQDVEAFLLYLENEYKINTREIEWVELVSHKKVRSWMSTLIGQNISKRSVARKIASVNAYFRYLLKTGQAKQNPASRVSIPKSEKKLPVFLKQTETQNLFENNYFSDDFQGWRDRSILEVLYGCGLRRAEVVGLEFKHIHFSQGVLKVLGKGNKERIIPFGEHVRSSFMKYMQLCEEQGFDYTREFFLSDKGNKLYPRLVHNIVNRYISLISTITQKSPHVLRHTFATHLLDEGADLNAIKEMLGHTSLAATQVYVHNSIAKLKKVYRQAHPKA